MALTTQERTNLITLVVGMFNASPGATYLSELTVAFEANGRSYQNLALDLANTDAFKSVHPVFQTAEEFAASFLTPLGLQANAEALDFVISKFNAGVSKGQIIFDALVALLATTAPEFADAKAILLNKVAVAEYHSVTQQIAETDLADLQAVLDGVTADPATVEAAKDAIDGLTGETFTLTTDQDNVQGTSGNDTILAVVDGSDNTLTLGDVINGDGGTDTLSVVTDQFEVDLGIATISGVENVVVDSRSDNLETVSLNNGAFASFVLSGNNEEYGSLDIEEVDANTAVTIENADFDESSVDIFLSEKDVGINGALTLKNVTDANVNVVVDDSVDGSAADDVFTLTLDDVSGGQVYVTDIETFNVVVSTDSEVNNIGNYYNNDGSLMGDVTVNLTANADLTVGFWDLNDDFGDTENTTFNITGAGNVTIENLDDGTSNVTVDASTATGDITILSVEDEVVSVTTGSGDDTIEISNSETVVALGDGVDTLIFGDALALNDDLDAFTADADGGAGDADVFEISAADAITSEGLLDDEGVTVTDFTDAVRNFERLSLTSVGTGAVDASLYGINDVIVDGVSDAADFTLTVADEALVEATGSVAVDAQLIVDVDGAADADDNSVTFTLNGEDGIGFAATIADVESIALVSTASDPDSEEPGSNSLVLTADEAVALSITGETALDLTGSSFAALAAVDAAGFDADLTIDVSSSGEEVTITVGNGDNDVTGSAQDDVITAGNGDNSIDGGAGDDTIVVGGGDNTITGGAGADDITIGAGVNTLVYAAESESTGLTVDTITGFNAADLDADEEVEAFNTFDLTALTAGDVVFLGSVSNATLANTALVDTSGNLQVIYVTGENTLYGDANDNGVIDTGDLAITLVGLTGTLSQDNFDVVV